MNPYIFTLSLGQIAGQRRTIMMLLLAALPVLLAVVFEFAADPAEDPMDFFAAGLVRLVVGLTLPLTALVFGTAVLGQDLEDGTAVYLLGKPLPRWRILVEKAGAAWVATAALTALSVATTGVILLAGEGGYRAIPAFAAAAALGSLAYVSLFLCLSVFFSRALIIGLVYVFVWEASVSAIVSNLQYVSIRGFTLGIADWAGDAPRGTIDATLGPVESFALIAAATALTIFLGSRRLASFEIGEQT